MAMEKKRCHGAPAHSAGWDSDTLMASLKENLPAHSPVVIKDSVIVRATQEDKIPAVSSVVNEESDLFSTMEQELLPGLPNDVTLAHITTKINWDSVMVLSNVSHTWKQVVEGRLVHDTRVRRHCAKTYDVTYCSPPFLAISRNLNLHSDGNAFIKRTGGSRAAFRSPCATHFVVLDGRVYSLGIWIGTISDQSIISLKYASAEVYVLDLAACSKQWVRCAPMNEARSEFVCGVKNGEMHVVGGWNGNRHINTEEAYDPNSNTWCSMPISDDWWREFQFPCSVDI
jgi:hypothetical protein